MANRLDYSVLYGASKEQVANVQCVQNAAARLLMNVGKLSHIAPILSELQWPPIQARIKFKSILFAFKVVHNLAPSCINSLLTI